VNWLGTENDMGLCIVGLDQSFTKLKLIINYNFKIPKKLKLAINYSMVIQKYVQ